jgi:hypothetical protein
MIVITDETGEYLGTREGIHGALLCDQGAINITGARQGNFRAARQIKCVF